MKYQVLCFDMDGTIMKTDVGLTYAHREASKVMNIQSDAIENPSNFIGPSNQYFCEKYLNLNEEECIRYDELFREFYLDKGVYMKEIYPGMLELMRDAKAKGYKVYICTAKDQKAANHSAKEEGLLEHCDGIYGSLGVADEKDAILRRLLESEEIAPEKAVMIGDRFTDLNGGKVCGTKTIGVLYGYGTREEVEGCEPDYIAKTVSELREHLLDEAAQ